MRQRITLLVTAIAAVLSLFSLPIPPTAAPRAPIRPVP